MWTLPLCWRRASGNRAVSARLWNDPFLSDEAVRDGQPSAVAVDLAADGRQRERAEIGGLAGRTHGRTSSRTLAGRCKALVPVSGYC
jgi:hypothetical protein